MNANEIAPTPIVRRVTIDADPAEFNDAVANSAFAPANVVITNAHAFAAEIEFDATDADLDAYLAYFELPADERNDIFLDA